MSAKTHYLAIGYRWSLVPPEVSDFDVALVLSSCRATAYAEGTTNLEEAETIVYHSKLPEKSLPHELSDVSGNLGLLHPVSDKHAERKVAAFERLVADSILWRLARETFHPSEKTVIILQGPLLPKLRGRLMYRGLSDRVTFCALTHQPNWFRRIEAAEQSYKALQREGVVGFGPVYPPRPLDRGTRSWVFRSAGGTPTHFEVITNMLDCGSSTNRDWLRDVEATVGDLVQPDSAGTTNSNLFSLPEPLVKVSVEAENARKRENEFVRLLVGLRRSAYDLDKLCTSSAFSPIIQAMKQSRGESGDRGFGIEDCIGPENEEDLYALFKASWPFVRKEADSLRERQKEMFLIQPEIRQRPKEKEIRVFANELWDSIDGLVEANGRRRVQHYLKKVAQDSLIRGEPRIQEIRGIFLDRKLSEHPEGSEIFNRFNAELIIRQIVAKTGIVE